jgi:hypothetical protein
MTLNKSNNLNKSSSSLSKNSQRRGGIIVSNQDNKNIDLDVIR